jgi:hypothetical protein
MAEAQVTLATCCLLILKLEMLYPEASSHVQQARCTSLHATCSNLLLHTAQGLLARVMQSFGRTVAGTVQVRLHTYSTCALQGAAG